MNGFEGEATIYALTDFEDNVFYIGCTVRDLNKRLIGHIASSKAYKCWSNNLKDQKVRSLEFKVKIKKLDSITVKGVDSREACRSAAWLESRWIKKYLSNGISLCNCSYTERDYQSGSNKKSKYKDMRKSVNKNKRAA